MSNEATLDWFEADGIDLSPWTLEEALPLVRQIENLLKPKGFHCALGGSVLMKGKSDKDLDIFIYPRKISEEELLFQLEKAQIQPYLSSQLGITNWGKCDHSIYGDIKEVWYSQYKGKRIDFFFVR